MFQLFVSGNSPLSGAAILHLRRMCESHLKGRYRLEVVDIYQQPELAAAEQIVAAPTLLKKSPLPVRQFLGDMSRPHRLMAALGLDPAT